jgi:hypothetical protein
MNELTPHIPPAMWEELGAADAKTSALIATSLSIQRLTVVRIGKKYGFTEEQLETAGLIAPKIDRRLQPGDLKGGKSRAR